MPFGLKNKPTTFQNLIDVILASVKWQHAIVYIDDTTVFSNTKKERLMHINEVLLLLRNAGKTIKLKTCSFSSVTTDYLEQVIASGRVQVAQKTQKSNQNATPPNYSVRDALFFES